MQAFIYPDAGFPEASFPPAREGSAIYWQRVEAGRRRMRASSCAIVGLARNIAGVLPATIQRVERLGALFGDYRVFVYENDSSDHTAELLTAWAGGNGRVQVVCEQKNEPVYPPLRCLNRASGMARCRSRCQEQVRTSWPWVDYVGVVDLDLAGGWSFDGAAHTFGCEGWDSVGSNGLIYQRQRLNAHVALHYDVWAYRRQGSYEALPGREGNLLSWGRGEGLVSVYSCFGGLGFYLTRAWLAAPYGGEDCEHVVLHRGMRELGYGRQYLNPNQITLYGRKRKRWDSVVLALDAAGRLLNGSPAPLEIAYVA